ncbi:MAG: cytochrome C oxidase subunit IV family protein [Candidatus Binatus sp.]|uniref:cytochrome C oxidase subunit IV family protein n=1 Tax=Candidatus Binatus sp. TaxID=2811406 RepID=UPI00271FB3E4|nr:cytochrome C oxidase subunit IV family protein [Candidatus Binatus sp.]MDO8432849.1 cytochrome C oxidase subunit IV family protein [Candidatus Binatus sp.]
MTTQAAVSSNLVHTEDHETNYIAVFIYLSILTGIELVVYAMSLPQVLRVGLLIALAWAKAVIVAMYFMHLAMERRGLWIIAITPVVLLVFLCFMLLPDLTTRMWTRFDHKIKAPVSGEAVAPPAEQLPPGANGS